MSRNAISARAFRATPEQLYPELFMVYRTGASLPLIYLCAVKGIQGGEGEYIRPEMVGGAYIRPVVNSGNQLFFTNSDFSFIGPKPSILQSML
ncbi:Uncharacterised protein [Serratia fonticola]|nr:Uncharacterised protein [Serratia fonticola]